MILWRHCKHSLKKEARIINFTSPPHISAIVEKNNFDVMGYYMHTYMLTGDYEVQDYKGRTPLHLAAELDRTVAAEYLLSLDPPAECRVTDKQGNHAITSMIRTMPQVVSLLVQFNVIATMLRSL